MVRRFGQFELDEKRRELRLRGEEIAVQPRVFDLLAMLYRNRDRVVTKDELLDALWPGVVVGDGSLQRAVSLARSALKQGGLGEAIRNYARQGYRFCLSDRTEGAEPGTAGIELDAARTAFERGDWEAAVEAYRLADSSSALAAADLEKLADACQCSGRAAEAEPVLERAVAASSARGDCRTAARTAFRLAEIAFESGRVPVAQGWFTRGHRYLKDVDEGWEHGFEAYLSARIATMKGEPEAAHEHARRGFEIGQRLGSDDIEAMNLVYLGFSELTLGNVETGTARIDEAAAMVMAGNVGLRAGGIVYCGVIWVCCNRGDWQRAAQWSDSFSRWCERGGMTRFSGVCQLHRAEILSISGEPTEAEEEIHRAREQVACCSPYAEGDSFRILGDLLLMRGDLERAEDAFRRAHELGWDPQPGLAMLQAENGDPESAIRTLTRSLDDRNWALRQRRALLLAQLVIIAAQHGDRDRAVRAMEELRQNPGLWESDFHGGAVARARAELAVLQCKPDEAVMTMRDAIRHWQSARATLQQATCRLRLAQLLANQGDIAGALLELDAAQSSYEAMLAPRRAETCAQLRESLSGTERERRISG
jgi:DNA-binding winged helix-turn-helix (wHTH) protein/ATP/maltotriose-dependent transcriptional regulator MalT